jgi:hypothetical protein
MNKGTERKFLAHCHTHRILTQFNHWPTKALESNPLKLHTVRILRLASKIEGLELENPPPHHGHNDIAAIIRATSHTVDETRKEKRQTIQCTMGTKEYDTLVRQQCEPIRYSNNLLKHLAPIWETGIHIWKSLLTIKHTSPTSYTYHIHPTDAILAKLPQG